MPSEGLGSIAANLDLAAKNVEFKLRNIRATWLGLLFEGPMAESPP